MIEMPKRSVTRFFIPLIDVLTLLFCIYLLMPVATPEDAEGAGPDAHLSADERRELGRLRLDKDDLQKEVTRLRQRMQESPRLLIRLLQTGEKGKLFFSDPKKPTERTEIVAAGVPEFLREQRREAAGRELYFLIVTPKVGTDFVAFPIQSQLEEYDRWFDGYAHGHIYYALPGK